MASEQFKAGQIVRVNKPGSSHDGYTAKVIGPTQTGKSFRVSLGSNVIRTYYTEHLRAD